MVFLISAVAALAALSPAVHAQAVVVGRVHYVEGDLLRYVPAENDWITVVQDAPFGTGDTFFSTNQAMSELIVPNGTWIRTGGNTQVQFIALDTDISTVDVLSGIARFYNKSSNTIVRVTSPFGYVLSYPGSIFDFYVGENSIELIAIKGTVSFIHSSTQGKYDIAAGAPSLLADQRQVSSGEGIVDLGWDRWNRTRDDFWAAKARIRGQSVEYLPSALRDDAYVLEENGRWETAIYEGRERWFWRPAVTTGWAPFTVGRWTEWEGDQTWVPAEPFGYLTHHYGNWVFVGGSWLWAPPVASIRVGLPLLDVGFFWTPGRVSWIYNGGYVGWVPLAPSEPYYGHRHWGGRHDVVVTNVAQVTINVRNYRYASHAVIVSQSNLYGVTNYRNVRVTNINKTTIINNYRAAPVINNTVINNYAGNKQRFNFTNVAVKQKPHNTVLSRIQQNNTAIRQGRRENAVLIEQQVRKMPEGRINRQATIEQPKTTNYIVPANQVNRPMSEMNLPQRAIKVNERGGLQGQPPGQTRTEKPSQPEHSARPAKLGGADQKAFPERSGQQGVPRQTPPSRLGQQDENNQSGQVAFPPRQSQARPVESGQRPGVTPPPKPDQQGQSKQVAPLHGNPGQSGQRGQITAPSRRGQDTDTISPNKEQTRQPDPTTPPTRPVRQPAEPSRRGIKSEQGTPSDVDPGQRSAPQFTPRAQPVVQPKPEQQPAPYIERTLQPKPAPQHAPKPQKDDQLKPVKTPAKPDHQEQGKINRIDDGRQKNRSNASTRH
jgi:hypothetical protein